MVQLKKKSLKSAALATLALLLLSQFNNCGTYSAPGNSDQSSLYISCLNDACVTPTLDDLSIKVNVGGGAEYRVHGSLTEWNLGGDCNEAGYPSNVIIWQLYLNGVKVRDSDMIGMAGATSVNSRCVNGRFLLYLNMSPITSDNVNRTGLNSPTGRRQYDLYVEICGQDFFGGQRQCQSGGTTSRTHISLLPI